MKRIQFLLLPVLMLALSACEKEVVIDLNDACLLYTSDAADD